MTKTNIKDRKEKFIDFKKVGAIVEKNFIVMTRDKIRLLPLLLFPIVMILVLGFTSGNTPKHIPAAIVVYDHSAIAQNIQQQIYNSQTFSIKYLVSTEDEAKHLLDAGKVSVIIEIPPKLGEDIDNNIPAQIIVIVDESDSAISATSNQALAVIINNAASSITLQKLQAYQQSVDDAASSLGNFASNQRNQYGIIAQKVAAAGTYLDDAQALNKQYSNALASSMPSLSAVVIPVNSSVAYKNTIMNLSNSDVIFAESSPAAAQTKAQIAIIQKSSALISTANGEVHAAQSIASQANNNQQQLQQAYDSQVLKPLMTIQMFTKSNAGDIMRPLSSQDKAAYGSGLKAIDFLIPSLIALTIFQGAVMGMGRSVAGEKREGSLTRVFLTPTSNTTIIVGTLSFYVLFELVRATFLIIFSIVVFNIKIQGSLLLIALILMIYITISTSIGMIISSLVKTEQQFQAMAMLVSLPTMFLSGAFFPLQAMPKVIQSISYFLPITYAGNALRGVMVKALPLGMIGYPMIILLIFLAICMAAVTTVFKRDIE